MRSTSLETLTGHGTSKLSDFDPSDLHPVRAVERLGVIMQPLPGEATELWGVLNPAVARGRDGQLYLFARVVAEGNYSRIRMTRVLFDDHGHPTGLDRLGFVLEPEETYERSGTEAGCEDPRVTFLACLDKYVMAYTALGPRGPRVALAVSDDLFNWERLGLVEYGIEDGIDFDAFDNKDAYFFPEPISGPHGEPALGYVHRPMTGVDQDGKISSQLQETPASIWISYASLPDAKRDIRTLITQRHHHVMIQPEHRWESTKIGGGTPPVLTPCGWLMIHHGIERVSHPDTPRLLRYSAGAFIVDRWDVRRVVWRSSQPVMMPDTEEELFGIVNNVVFPTGIDERAPGMFDVYYGMADAKIGVARMWLTAEAIEDGVISAA